MNSYQKRLQEIYILENQVEDLDFTIMQLAEDNRRLKKEIKIWIATGFLGGIAFTIALAKLLVTAGLS